LERTEPIAARLPALLVVSAAGLLVVALADNRARAEVPGAQAQFWVGLLAAYLPLALLALAPGVSRRERIAAILSLTVLLSLVKVLQQPGALTFYDELAHWRSLLDIQRTGHLFTPNPLLGISSSYPGLESATAALAGATGLPAPAAAATVVGAARLVLVLALFLFLERVTGAARPAAAGAVVFVSNPRFVFFDDQFAYESMALGLAALVLFLEVRRTEGDAPRAGAWALLAVCAAALAVTHHATSYLLLAFLVLWGLVANVLRRYGGDGRAPARLAVLMAVVVALWLAVAARPTFAYLAGGLAPALQQVTAMAQHRGGARHLFQASNGQVQPRWQQALALGSALLITGALALGLLRLWRERLERRRQAPLVALALVALCYPASLALHLAPDGAEIANRTSEFVFVGLGAALALAIDRAWPARRLGRARAAAVAGWLSVVFSGGTILGWPPQLLLPGPYLVGADSRSIDAAGVAAATWARDRLGPDNRFTADRTNRNLLGTYGGQYPVSDYNDGVVTAQVFLSPAFDDADRSILRQGGVRYLLVDRRLSTARPLVGVYFEDGEPDTRPQGSPIPASWLAKFDAVPDASCVYDGGDIRIYDMEALLRGR
jgi:flagellar biogenesis protein FliO